MAYYSSCLDTETINKRGTRPLDDLIKEYGSWTITSNDWNEESWDMVKYLAAMRRKIAVAPFFSVFISADPRNSTINVIQVRSNNFSTKTGEKRGIVKRDHFTDLVS